MSIQKLPIQLANQIAAGEVVERPASVVKELVENSIDAGATEIQIDIERGGHRRIRIRDNGSGILKDELTLALSRHATSKITTLDDLEAILSLGFRGEALASISSVSRLTLTSKTEEQESAWKAFCEGRDMDVHVEPASHPTGTTVDVEDLFFNTPARRKFLRTEKTEMSHIDEVIRRIALARPDIGFKLTHNGQTSKHFPRAKSAEPSSQRVAKVIGGRFMEESVKLESEVGDLHVNGWVAPASVCRHQQDVQYFYVNGRMMKDKLLNHAVRQAYGETLAEDRFATYVLYLTLPANQVDVNVHPAKHEVRFHQSRQIHDFVLSAVRTVLSDSEHTEQPAASHDYQPPDPSIYQQASHSGSQVRTGAPAGAGYSARPQSPPKQAVETWSRMMALPAQSTERWTPVYLLSGAVLMVKGDEVGVVPTGAISSQHELQKLKEKLAVGLAGQPLLLPTQFEYDQMATVLTDFHQQLSLLGIELRQVSASRAAILKVPALLRHTALAQTLPQLLSLLQASSSDIHLTERLDVLEWLASEAGAKSLSLEQLNEAWQAIPVDQKPTVNTLAWQDLVFGNAE
ncbi:MULTISPECIES: DNA mismatch repair endonuclease MutL [Gammaproteobacteria]|uniref:DNA mismatch repair endonuclease MutL n=1 Tax=Gammaproteobacteria TaxID=1236 RepID=UPI000DD04068|nr:MULTISPECIES: DNA mismatch repair endonuclease MutL [Gammaproteobacteria]RTE86433.1 DNA mismatch repair endonuclease MutL [Aliidiomarina sp. B3213]TCZ91011.1 DNA mismatch repair endonuclease MutL [Lysobacter sp. N42]